MKPIGAQFGFWLLLAMGTADALIGSGDSAATLLVGAVLFNAIKSQEAPHD